MVQLKLEHRFDANKNRHYLNDMVTVLHCHHYATLFTQLAIDARDLVDGTKIMTETTEDVITEFLNTIFRRSGIANAKERLELGVQLYSAAGLGKMVIAADENGGSVQMPHAHVDEGWLKKWGKCETPVNFIGCGFIAAVMAAAYSQPPRTYKVSETQSIVSGASQSIFKINK